MLTTCLAEASMLSGLPLKPYLFAIDTMIRFSNKASEVNFTNIYEHIIKIL